MECLDNSNIDALYHYDSLGLVGMMFFVHGERSFSMRKRFANFGDFILDVVPHVYPVYQGVEELSMYFSEGWEHLHGSSDDNKDKVFRNLLLLEDYDNKVLGKFDRVLFDSVRDHIVDCSDCMRRYGQWVAIKEVDRKRKPLLVIGVPYLDEALKQERNMSLDFLNIFQ